MTPLKRKIGQQTLEKHQNELTVALDLSSRLRSAPPILPTKHRRILDVGCGMGQTLLAARLPNTIEAYGVDSDMEAVAAGRRLVPSNINLLCAGGENLPFEDQFFDLVLSRVALPYMDINKALREFSRVLKSGGDLWLALHPASMVLDRAKRSACLGNSKDVLVCSYVLLNGMLFNCFGVQVSLLGRQETFQTVKGIEKAMKRAGLVGVPALASTHFIVEGHKPSATRDFAA